MGLIPQGPVYKGPDPLGLKNLPADGGVDFVADFANSATGTGKNLGFWGKVDRGVDPRNFTQDREKARNNPDLTYEREPNEETTGLSGAAQATGEATGAGAGITVKNLSEGAAKEAVPEITSSPWALGLVALVLVVLLGQLFNFNVGGGD